MKILPLALAVAFWATEAGAVVQTKVVEYKQGDAVLEGFLAWDDAAQRPAPGVLVRRRTSVPSTPIV